MDLSFKQWLAAVNRILLAKVGMGIGDLADCCYRDWYDDEVSPADAADMVLEDNDFGSF